MNPLDVFSPPKKLVAAIWSDSSLSKEQKAESLYELVKRMYRALMRTVHSDTAGESFKDLAQGYTQSFQAITPNYAVLKVFVDWYLTNVGATTGQEADLKRDYASAEARSAAFFQFLPQVDWRRVLGMETPSEVLFGLPYILANGPRLYTRTYALGCEGVETTLTSLIHPPDHNPIASLERDFVGVPEWRRDQWYGFYSNNKGSSIACSYERSVPQGNVTLIGHVPFDIFTHEPNRSTVGELVKGKGGPVQAGSDLEWLNNPPWLSSLRPGVHDGYAVVARQSDEGVVMAVVGSLLTSRPL